MNIFPDKLIPIKRINSMREEQRAERIAARQALAKAKSEKRIRVKVWKFDYMAKRKQDKVAKCLGLQSSDTGRRITGLV